MPNSPRCKDSWTKMYFDANANHLDPELATWVDLVRENDWREARIRLRGTTSEIYERQTRYPKLQQTSAKSEVPRST